MNSIPTPKVTEPNDALVARADERLAQAYEKIARADEQLARVSEQLAKLERDATPPPSAGPGPQSPPQRSGLRALVGLLLAACIVFGALFLQSTYGGGARLFAARWAPWLVSTRSSPCMVRGCAAGESAARVCGWSLPMVWSGVCVAGAAGA